jgi:hypothetical protein
MYVGGELMAKSVKTYNTIVGDKALAYVDFRKKLEDAMNELVNGSVDTNNINEIAKRAVQDELRSQIKK